MILFLLEFHYHHGQEVVMMQVKLDDALTLIDVDDDDVSEGQMTMRAGRWHKVA